MDKTLLTITSTSLPGRYARALFATSQEASQIDQMGADFLQVENFAKNQPEITKFLFSKALSKKQLIPAWQIVGEKLGLSPVFLNFITVLIKERRLDLFSEIKKIYSLFVDRFYNKRSIVVTSALTLESTEKTKMRKALSHVFSETLEIRFTVDESLLSGIVVKADTLMLDASFLTQLNHLADILKGNE